MLMFLSPAKAMNFDPAPAGLPKTKPALMAETKKLEPIVKGLTRADLKKLMGVSDDLADLNYERFQALKTSGRIAGAKQAALTFAGDVYRGLDANSLEAEDLQWAQDRLRILSGLYGLLKPLDAVQPYRLEMGSRLENPRGANLVSFWKPVIAPALDRAAAGHDDPTVVCLSSPEYAKSVDVKSLKSPYVVFNFKETKDGATRAIQTYVKLARGMMARWAIENRVDRAEGLKDFTVGGYKFSRSLSSEGEWIFSRPQPKPKTAAKKKKAA